MKVLLITYKYTDKEVRSGSLGKKLKTYYELNSRGSLKIELTSVKYQVPFNSKQVSQAHRHVKKLMPKGFDAYVHFCNPKISRTGNGNVVTYASYTNTIHEFGHIFGLSHGNTRFNLLPLKHSRDPFDQMTIFSPYPSTNAVHRVQMKWYLESELIVVDLDQHQGSNEYSLGMLRNFDDRDSLKIIEVLKNGRKYFISYGSKFDKKKRKTFQYVTVHTIYGSASSVLIGMHKAVDGVEYVNKESELVIKVLEHSPRVVKISII